MVPNMTFKTSLFMLLLCATVSHSTYQPCPIRGPLYPSAHNLLSSSSVQAALQNLTDNFDASVAGKDVGNGLVISNTTTFSVALFSTSNDSIAGEPFIYQYHKAAAETKGADSPEVDSDSIYRIGDISMVFTIWALLINAGSQIWERPVTEFVPELAQLANLHDKSAINTVAWEDILVGDLASHMAGIGRDCE